jgi:hypothetical protein
VINVSSSDDNIALVGLLKKIEATEKRGLSTARRADYRKNLAALKSEIYSFKYSRLAKAFFEIFYF